MFEHLLILITECRLIYELENRLYGGLSKFANIRGSGRANTQFILSNSQNYELIFSDLSFFLLHLPLENNYYTIQIHVQHNPVI